MKIIYKHDVIGNILHDFKDNPQFIGRYGHVKCLLGFGRKCRSRWNEKVTLYFFGNTQKFSHRMKANVTNVQVEDVSEKKLIFQGAEGKVYRCKLKQKDEVLDCLCKERFKKAYRHPVLDGKLTKARIRAETRNLQKAAKYVNVPKVYGVNVENGEIYMEFIEGVMIKDVLSKESFKGGLDDAKEVKSLLLKIGDGIAKFHMNDMIHGDITTSNIMCDEKLEKIYFVDLGLSQVTTSVEDFGVDLYVLERAIISTHLDSEEIFKTIMEGYEASWNSSPKKKVGPKVLQRFEIVRTRGRKRDMCG